MDLIFRQALVLILVAAVAALASAFFHRDLFSTSAALASDETTWAQVAVWQQAEAGGGAGANATHILILDARPDDAYRAAHVPGALLLNETHWERLLPAVIASLRDNTRIVVYCDDTLCQASHGVATRLRRELALDESDVFVLKGGWREWLQTHPQ